MNPRGRSNFIILALTGGLIFTVGPLVWMLVGAFADSTVLDQVLTKLGGNAPQQPWPDLSKLFTLDQFRLVCGNGRVAWWTFNSLAVAGIITLAQLTCNALAAFAFSMGRFRGREPLFWVVLATMMVPGQIVMLPLFLLMGRLGLLDSLWAVILPKIAAPYGIYLVRQYMDGIPKELLDAARIDGASEWQVFRNIAFPLAMPILATSGIFVFITHWNAFLWPLVVLNSDHRYTLTVGLATMQDQQAMDHGLLMAGATVSALPMILVFIAFSRYLLTGMRAGAIKG